MYDATALGQNGSVFLHPDWNYNATTGPYAAVHCLTNTVFQSLVDTASNNWGGLTVDDGDGITVPAGTVLYGRFTTIILATGMAVAYKSTIK